MELSSGSPFRGAVLEKLKCFLHDNGLKYDQGVEYSIFLSEDDRIAATGSLDGSVLKCVAVSSSFRSEGLAARIISELVSEAARRGHFHLFLFTKPENYELFDDLGFYPIAKTGQVLLMENKKNGVQQFVDALHGAASRDTSAGAGSGVLQGADSRKTVTGAASRGAADSSLIGAIVVNCNPFTLGHLYLMETAAKQCGLLYIFVVSENKSRFSAETRLDLVSQGTAHLPNVRVCPTGPYLVSAATFPDYFLKDSGTVSAETLNTELDLTIFAQCFAGPLGIKRRYVGTEPFDRVTAVYNKQMGELLPSFGIEVVEIPRLENSGGAVSASRVRRLLDEGSFEAVRELVPLTTYDYLIKNQGGAQGEKS